MKKYTFTHTKPELLELCIKILMDRERRRPVHTIVLVIMLLVCSMTFASTYFPLIFFLFYAVLVSIDIAVFYRALIKQGHLQEKTMWIENGVLKCSASANIYSEIPCEHIHAVKKGKRLLMLGVIQTKTQIAWYCIPVRVFSDQKELYEFLQMLKSRPFAPNQAVPVSVSVSESEPVQEDFHFSFLMDLDKWVEIEKEAWETLRSNAPDKAKRTALRFAVYLLASLFMIALLYSAGLSSLPTYAAAIAFFFLLIARTQLTNPEKQLRKNMAKKISQSNLLGEWNVWFSETGISYDVAYKRKTTFPWEEFNWMAETENAFYFMRKNSQQFIAVPKECIRNYEQAATWLQYCNNKGFIPVKIKKAVYVPAWIFVVLIVLSMLTLLGSGMWLASQRH